jgi:inhibitor of KinA sporulation pathway (predicted exonuclease)
MPWLRRASNPRDLSVINVVDLEATCYENGAFPAGETQEIIEMGVCVLRAATGERYKRQSLLVRPQASLVSPFCSELTGLTQADVDRGLPLGEAGKVLVKEYKSSTRVWAGWGEWDRQQMEQECQSKGIRSPMSSTYLNISLLFALAFNQPRERSLSDALALLGLRPEGELHHAADDAWNAALLLHYILSGKRVV